MTEKNKILTHFIKKRENLDIVCEVLAGDNDAYEMLKLEYEAQKEGDPIAMKTLKELVQKAKIKAIENLIANQNLEEFRAFNKIF